MSRTAERKPTRSPLTRQRVLEAALRYADEHGLDALSMHKLGAQLGVKGMSLYNHVQGKDALLDGMVEIMWSELDASVAGDDWRQAIRSLATSLRALVHRHPRSAPLLVSRQVMPENALRICDAHLRVMRDGGVPEDFAAFILRTIFAYGFGYALAEQSCFPSGPGENAEEDELQRIRRVSALVPPDVPDQLMRVALGLAGQCDMRGQFDMGVDLMIRGLDDYLARQGS